MSYERLEPHGRLTIASAEFAWDFFVRNATSNNDDRGNSILSPILVQHHMVFMCVASSGETRKQLLKAMRLKEDENVDELMRWALWCFDYYVREVALSYGTKPRSALVIGRSVPLKYTETILPWVNHYRIRKSYHVVKELVGNERTVSAILRRLTGAYPRSFLFEDLFVQGAFRANCRAVIASALYFQLFLPSAGCNCQLSDRAVPFWRVPKNDTVLEQGDEELKKVRALKLVKDAELLEDEHCEIVGLDLYPANLSAYFILPKDVVENGVMLNVNQSLISLQNKLDGRILHDYVQKLLPQRTRRTVQLMITLPRFGIRVTSDLEQTMRNMGLECVFQPTNKDWTNLFADYNPDGGDFYLSSVRQDVLMQLLATSTSSTSYLRLDPMKENFPSSYTGRQITFNRPFLFFVYDHFSRTFEAFGRCQNPCLYREPVI